MKIYYNENGYVCEVHPYFYKPSEERYIEVEDEEGNQIYAHEIGFNWFVENGKLIYKEDPIERETDEYKTLQLNNQKAEYQSYLDETDYVIAKLNELKLEDDDTYETEKEKYKEVLEKRKDCRNKLRELK